MSASASFFCSKCSEKPPSDVLAADWPAWAQRHTSDNPAHVATMWFGGYVHLVRRRAGVNPEQEDSQ